MNHLGTVSLKTERLILRKFTKEDISAMFHNWASDAEVTKFLTWPAHSSMEITKMVINDWLSSYNQKDYYQWAIALKSLGNKPIGTISIVHYSEDLNSVEIGYCIGRKWWHQGIMSEAFKAVITFLFEQVKVNRIAAKHDSNNPHSGDVMRKCGLKYEGTLRQAERNNQGIVDVALYSILAEDYFN